MTDQKYFFKKNAKFYVLSKSPLLATHFNEFTLISPVGGYGYHVTIQESDLVEYSGSYENLNSLNHNVVPEHNVGYFVSFSETSQKWVLDKNALIYDIGRGLDTFLSGQPTMFDQVSWVTKWQKLPSFWSYLNCYRKYCEIVSLNDGVHKDDLKKIWEFEYALTFSTYPTTNYYSVSKAVIKTFWDHRAIVEKNHEKYKTVRMMSDTDAKLGAYWSIFEDLKPIFDDLMALDYQ